MHPDVLLSTITSWPHFQERVSTLPEKQKGDVFERLVVLTLQFHPRYTGKVEQVWLGKDVPFDVRAHLEIPIQDYGIDIVVRTVEGEFWAVQAKYRSKRESSVPWSELDSFVGLAFGVSTQFSLGLVCSTTNHVTSIIRKNTRIRQLKADFWSHLDEEFFSMVRARVSGRRELPIAKEPQYHQREVIAAAILHFKDAGETRGKFISPCGSGKTLTAWWIANALNASRVIVAVPSLVLITQTLGVWLREALATGRKVNWLCVCSDDTAGDVERDGLINFVQDTGIPSETDPARLIDAMRKLTAPLQIIFTTYQSSPSLAIAAKSVGWQCDLAIFDEAHKTVSPKSSPFAHLLFDTNLPISRRIFMTATERRYRESTEEVVSMDDPDIYGPIFHLLSFKTALESVPPVLCDYEIMTIGVRDAEVRKLIEDRRYILTRGAGMLTAADFACQIALRRAVEKYGIRHTITFHTSIKRAAQFTDFSMWMNSSFPDLPNIYSLHVSGEMASTERDMILRHFADREPSLVSNARCLTEGVDVPGIDCVMFVDPKGSTVDIVQAAGRAMRISPGKIKAYIVLPFVVREDATVDEAAHSQHFDAIVTVLRALASQDDRIIDELRSIHQERPPGSSRVLNFDMGTILPSEIEAEQFIRAIELECWGRLKQLAWMPFEDAIVYVQVLGLKTQKQFRAWQRGLMPEFDPCPPDMPASPDGAYAGKGWTTWGDFLGTGRVSTRTANIMAYEEAKAITRKIGLKNASQWIEYSRRDIEGRRLKLLGIPSRPDDYYKGTWVGWPDFLGYERKSLSRWRSFIDALRFVRSLRLGGQKQWKEYCVGRLPDLPKRPSNIPTDPDNKYKGVGWVNWADWVGTKIITVLDDHSLPIP